MFTNLIKRFAKFFNIASVTNGENIVIITQPSREELHRRTDIEVNRVKRLEDIQKSHAPGLFK